MPDSFHDIQFPVDIALGSRGGPSRRTEIVTLASGHERRTARWAQSRRRFAAGYGVKCRADLEAVIAFFEARKGRRYAFRFRDPFDHRSGSGGPTATDQLISTGGGSETVFQLTKTYSSGSTAYERPITLPVEGSVSVAIDGTALTEGTDYTVDTLTGLVTFTAPPANGAAITAGFFFDIPARFDTDELQMELHPGGGEVPDIPIVEVRV